MNYTSLELSTKLGIMRKVFLILPLFLASCGNFTSGTPQAAEELSVRETAQRLISNDIAAVIGMGSLSPVCEEVADPFHGRDFRCSATSGDRNVYFTGKVEDDGRVSLETTNVLLATDLPEVEAAAISFVNSSLGSTYSTDSFSCGGQAIILNPEKVFACNFIEPTSGDVYGAEVQLIDVANRTVNVKIDSEPQS